MKRNPTFVYNNIDKQNLVYANQLTVKQWNDIVNKLTAQANANTAFLETWTRWFFGPVEYTTEDEYTDSLGTCDSYYDYLKAEFNRIDTRITNEANRLDGRINEEIYNREAQDNILSASIVINANDIVEERNQRIAQDNDIHNRINTVNQRVATEENNRMAEIKRLEGDDKDIRNSIVQENVNWNAADRNLQEQITDNKNTKLNSDLSNLPFASLVHQDDFLVIRCACDGEPATQKISIKVLAELINSEVDYFKGVFVDYDHLVDVWPVGEPGDYALVGSSDESLFIQYVWDAKANDGQGVWEETTSTQFVLPEVFSAHQQDLQDGNFVVGKSVISTTAESTSYYTDPDNPTMPKVDIKDLVPKPLEIEVRDEFSNAQGAGTMKELVIGGDVWRVPSDVTSIIFSSLPAEGDSYELRTITINGEKWQIPEGSKLDSEPLTLELSSERQEGANDLGSIRIGDDVWNMPQGGGSGSTPKKYEFSGVPVYMGDDLIPHLCGIEITDTEILNELQKVINNEKIVQVYYGGGYDVSKSSYLFTSAINFFTMDIITTGGLPSSGHGVAIIYANNKCYYCDTDFWDSNDSVAISKTIDLTFKFIELGNSSGGGNTSNSEGSGIKKITFTDRPSLYEWLVSNYKNVIKFQIEQGSGDDYMFYNFSTVTKVNHVQLGVQFCVSLTDGYLDAENEPDTTTTIFSIKEDQVQQVNLRHYSFNNELEPQINGMVLPDEYWSSLNVTVTCVYIEL